MIQAESNSGQNDSGGGRRGDARLTASNEKLVYTVPEAGALLGFSRNHSYELARRGEIPVIWFGKRMVVPKASFDKLLKQGDIKDER
ncbi:helix-turn-helix domain-containing protein [Chloroflexota bacterium]